MSLRELGYRNLQRNDVRLYHHESVSRGSDEEPERRLRRLKELEQLYDLHPVYRGTDPYYNVHLSGRSKDYIVESHFDWEDEELSQPVVERGDLGAELSGGADNDPGAGFMSSIDRAEVSDGRVLLDGWAFRSRADNAGVELTFILQPKREDAWEKDSAPFVYEVSAAVRYRPDVEQAFAGERHIALSGRVARFDAYAVEQGDYELCIRWKRPGRSSGHIIHTGRAIRI